MFNKKFDLWCHQNSLNHVRFLNFLGGEPSHYCVLCNCLPTHPECHLRNPQHLDELSRRQRDPRADDVTFRQMLSGTRPLCSQALLLAIENEDARGIRRGYTITDLSNVVPMDMDEEIYEVPLSPELEASDDEPPMLETPPSANSSNWNDCEFVE